MKEHHRRARNMGAVIVSALVLLAVLVMMGGAQ